MSQLKFILKIGNNILIGGGGPPGPIPWLRPYRRPQKTFPDRKNQASYTGIKPVTEKP